MQGRGNEAGMFMSSWVLDVLFKKHRGIYFQKEFMSHSFKFEKNTIINIDGVLSVEYMLGIIGMYLYL